MKGKRIIVLIVAVSLALVGTYLISTGVPCRVPDHPISADAGGWTEGASLPTPRSELAAAALDGKIYVAGGLKGTAAVGAFEVYDPAADAWRAAAELPRPVHHAALAGASGKVYLTGGYHDLAFQETSDATWAYDPARDAWEAVAPMPGPRGAHSMVEIGGKLYVVGGVPDATALWVYDPARDTWQTGQAPMPTPREHLASVVVEGKIYVVGGRWAGAGNVDALEVYDPATDRWEQRPAMPSMRGGLTAGAIGARIYVGGGENPWARWGSGCTYEAFEVYDTSAGQWLRLDELPTARHGLSSAVVDGRWFVIGGATRPTAGTVISASDRVEIYAPGR